MQKIYYLRDRSCKEIRLLLVSRKGILYYLKLNDDGSMVFRLIVYYPDYNDYHDSKAYDHNNHKTQSRV